MHTKITKCINIWYMLWNLTVTYDAILIWLQFQFQWSKRSGYNQKIFSSIPIKILMQWRAWKSEYSLMICVRLLIMMLRATICNLIRWWWCNFEILYVHLYYKFTYSHVINRAIFEVWITYLFRECYTCFECKQKFNMAPSLIATYISNDVDDILG